MIMRCLDSQAERSQRDVCIRGDEVPFNTNLAGLVLCVGRQI